MGKVIAISTKKYSRREEENVERIENKLVIGMLSLTETKGNAGKRKAEILLPVIMEVLRAIGN
ncbi:hypothetical protein [Borrelia venezuelensis]|uniref:hypothetical protein n=1 Tax=Borrelia venezuelensis TaxID=1653839 RepID=UPI001FF59705|nr:hypothetical protein [Borrelia venezuelensis]UPA11715.1 hypothetical protein bvRMA01_000001 [Borrelia venezuelensis]UPA12488.1 hypothetical protein bvRMA01_000866 [Borrelia venezuelensis]UPA12588.1 hypothetical protein bvRMA01_000918 [Borrelia venezuelensis]UPA12708.1 hypothetical protein bvRMA01_001044 [Borrelia venezuelensis]UPA12826.1 hypothetical protein bvRMA01_001170 [Borrelia venezuelensis]